MKIFKCLYIFLPAVLLFTLLTAPGALALENPEVLSSNIVLADTASNTVFYARDAEARVYPASLTKIMTILLAVEACESGLASPDDEITASDSMTADLIDDGSTAGIKVGETMSLKNLMYCAMVKSANEACNIIAEHIGGSLSGFVDKMNEKARELGCTGTLFQNASGVPDDNHYTTAWDMYLIASEAMSHSMFAEISSTVYVEIPPTNMSEKRYLATTNGLLSDESSYPGYYYEYAKGVKTGYTSAAGYCLISAAENNGFSLMAVVMGGVQTEIIGEDGEAKKDYSSFSDSIRLYEWGFNNFSFQDIIKTTTQIAELPVKMGANANGVAVRAQSAIRALLPNDVNLDDFEREIILYSERDGVELQAPISAGDVLGEITITRDGEAFGSVPLVAATGIELSKMYYITTEIQKALDLPVVKFTFWALVVLFAFYLVMVFRYRVRRVRHQRYVRRIKKERAGDMAESEAALFEAGARDELAVTRAGGESGGAGFNRQPPGQAGSETGDDDFIDRFFN